MGVDYTSQGQFGTNGFNPVPIQNTMKSNNGYNTFGQDASGAFATYMLNNADNMYNSLSNKMSQVFGSNTINPAAQSMNTSSTMFSDSALNNRVSAEMGNTAADTASSAASNINNPGLSGGDTGFFGDVSFGDAVGGALAAYNVWNSYQATKLAKEEMAFAKEQYYTNMRNSISSYNTNLQDRINGRHSSAERTQEQKDADYNNKKLQEV